MKEPDPCPKCKAPHTERQRMSGFGGYETEICKKCGHVYELKKEAPK